MREQTRATVVYHTCEDAESLYGVEHRMNAACTRFGCGREWEAEIGVTDKPKRITPPRVDNLMILTYSLE